MSEFLITPPGRLVQGDCFKMNSTGKGGKPLVDKDGKPYSQNFIAIAFRKDDPAFNAWWPTVIATVRQMMPQFFNPSTGMPNHPKFAWKLADGDGVDDDGKPNSAKPGFAGHWILKCASQFAPKCFAYGKYDPTQQLTDPNSIKKGHYIRASLQLGANTDQSKPGIFLNPSLIEWVAFGEEITSGPDAASVFNGAPAMTLPQGASVTPLMAAPTGMPGMAAPSAAPAGLPGMHAATPAPSMPGGMPAMGAPTAAPQFTAPGLPANPGAVPATAHTFVANQMGLPTAPAAPSAGGLPGMPGMGAPVQRQPVYTMTAAAQGFTREQYHQNGASDEWLVQNGYMTIQ